MNSNLAVFGGVLYNFTTNFSGLFLGLARLCSCEFGGALSESLSQRASLALRVRARMAHTDGVCS